MNAIFRCIQRFVVSLILFAGFAFFLLSYNPALLESLFRPIADPLADWLRQPGAAMREWVLTIPMWAAKGFFIVYYVGILVWVFLKKKEEVQGQLPYREKLFDVRPIVALSLLGLILIYVVF